ncbi:hypothetical protein JKP88DRAFT_276634 [Tribonema minus]|uniref:Uncharacterized protein n=1 Tax=Tribonema minus TaxID=303371 RepID=A0A835Z3E8_9STRA|nr:hypothetical protein JKP88DRAFT_276634 [Tribonema minus]
MDIVFGSNQAQGGARDVQRVLESVSQEKIDTYVVSGPLDPTTHTLYSAVFDHFGAMSRDTQALLHALAEQSSQGSYNLAQRVAFWRCRTSLTLQRALTRVVIDNWNAVIAPDGDVQRRLRLSKRGAPPWQAGAGITLADAALCACWPGVSALRLGGEEGFGSLDTTSTSMASSPREAAPCAAADAAAPNAAAPLTAAVACGAGCGVSGAGGGGRGTGAHATL